MTPLTAEETAWRQWAAGQLGLAVEAKVPQVRAEFFKRLAADDFAPAPTLRHAFVLLDHAPEDCPKRRNALFEARQAHQDSVATAVETFAQEFWKQKPAARQKRWNELMAAATWYPRVRARLDSLRSALSVEASANQCETEAAEELLKRLQALAICRPLERPALLHQLFLGQQGKPYWKLAIRRVRAQFPELAELSAMVMAELVEPPSGPAKPLRGTLRSEPDPPPPAKEPRLFAFRFPFILIFVVLTGLRLLFQGGCDSRPGRLIPPHSQPNTSGELAPGSMTPVPDGFERREVLERFLWDGTPIKKQTTPSSK